ncbi:hypothetical protein [Rhizosphaericola mali]|uniref:hypothetical protein n=1 Tax=Rhizosphaericola mali TaxID=2545455 RepID=UPI001787479D|nr:hypothetical protein [Rhizosphaericola mali]
MAASEPDPVVIQQYIWLIERAMSIAHQSFLIGRNASKRPIIGDVCLFLVCHWILYD